MRRIILGIFAVCSVCFGERGVVTIGGGNFYPGRNERMVGQFEVLEGLGAKMCRIAVSPDEYYAKDGKPHPERLDEVVLAAKKYDVTPMVLFEYYTRFHGDIGGYDKWYSVGKAFAERFAPGSSFLKPKGIDDWGIEWWSDYYPGDSATLFEIEDSSAEFNLPLQCQKTIFIEKGQPKF